MKKTASFLWKMISSRATPPLVIGSFLLVYIVIAFFTDETLIALMQFTRKNPFLTAMLALLPVSSGARLAAEALEYRQRKRAMKGEAGKDEAGELFHETVELENVSRSFEPLEKRLTALGYKTMREPASLAAYRGITLFPARFSFLLGVFCLFAGILVSLTSRTAERMAVIEGERIETASGSSGYVESISLQPADGLILSKKLSMAVSGDSGGKSVFGIYPPSLYDGGFIYPRYLGVGVGLKFVAPDLPAAYQTFAVLNLYPPGKEATHIVVNSPYRLVLSLQETAGEDPYLTGRMVFSFKLLKEKTVVASGTVPAGGEFVRDGYRLVFPDVRRVVITDLVRDYGVLLIWASGLLFLFAILYWLPVRIFCPRREMFFRAEVGSICAFSRSEGKTRKHSSMFHESLDFLEGEKRLRGDE